MLAWVFFFCLVFLCCFLVLVALAIDGVVSCFCFCSLVSVLLVLLSVVVFVLVVVLVPFSLSGCFSCWVPDSEFVSFFVSVRGWYVCLLGHSEGRKAVSFSIALFFVSKSVRRGAIPLPYLTHLLY